MRRKIITICIIIFCVAALGQGEVQWSCSYQEAPTLAQTQNKPIFVYFTAPNNKAAEAFEMSILNTPEVSSTLNSLFISVQVDIINEPELAAALSVIKIPQVVFIDSLNHEIMRITEFLNADRFLKIVEFIGHLDRKEPAVAVSAPAVSITPMNEINSDKIGKLVTVKGRIVNFLSPATDKSPYSYYITDGTETLRVVVWKDILDKIKNLEEFKVGTDIVVSGEVKELYNRFEINVNSSENVRLADSVVTTSPATAVPATPLPGTAVKTAPSVLTTAGGGFTPLSKLSSANEDQEVSVRGNVVNIKPSWKSTAPTTVTIRDESGSSVDIVYWPDVSEKLSPDQQPRVGSVVKASGKVAMFRNNVQIKVNSSSKLSIEGGASPAISPDAITSNSSITRDLIGQRVTISGKITDVIKVRNGMLIKVTDETGTLTVPLWDELGNRIPDKDKLKKGATVTLSGIVFLYEQRQELELQLNQPEDIKGIE